MTKAKSKQLKSKAPATAPEKGANVMDARGHKQGSRKSRVHQVWAEQDEATAFTLGQKLKLKTATLHSWFGHWRRAGKSAKPAKTEKKVAAKPTETAQPTIQ